ncbi:MAG TPA: methyltransferase domain-containing protein [Thermoleophilaceae bacterium]|nr:methyltransferase domain-containing protein [Thermoleophilaceae bacterium]
MRRLAHAAAKRVGAVRLRRLIAGTRPPYRLELGTNEVNHDGWIPTDVQWRARNYLDATGPWPFPEDSISHVYADNVIEHVSLDGARSLLREAARTMQPGGRIRLVTPDARRCAEVYLEGGERAEAQKDAHRGAGTRVEHDVDILRGVFIEYEHRYGYAWDQEALTAELEAAGFTGVERCELGESDDPALGGLEWRVLPIDRETMLVLEARAPGLLQ